MAGDLAELIVTDAAAWRAWLEHHHTSSSGTWLVLARKGTAAPTGLHRDDALAEALCFGWIDGQARSRDETSFLQRFTPRRPRSQWSQRNVEIVARLEREGRMRPAGLAQVAAAKADGRWAAAYAGPATAEVPPDLAAAVAASPRAAAMFAILTSQNRFAILHRLRAVKRPETRSRRIAGFVEMLERGETLYPQRRRLDPDPASGAASGSRGLREDGSDAEIRDRS